MRVLALTALEIVKTVITLLKYHRSQFVSFSKVLPSILLVPFIVLISRNSFFPF